MKKTRGQSKETVELNQASVVVWNVNLFVQYHSLSSFAFLVEKMSQALSNEK